MIVYEDNMQVDKMLIAYIMSNSFINNICNIINV